MQTFAVTIHISISLFVDYVMIPVILAKLKESDLIRLDFNNHIRSDHPMRGQFISGHILAVDLMRTDRPVNLSNFTVASPVCGLLPTDNVDASGGHAGRRRATVIQTRRSHRIV